MNLDSYDIYNVLERVRKRPGLYIGEENLNSLLVYIGGYSGAMMDAKIACVSKPEFGGFHEFVREKYGYSESTMGWANMILASTLGLDPKNIRWENYDNDVSREQYKESINVFYKLLDEFKKNT